MLPRCSTDVVLDDAADGESCFRELHRHFGRPDAWRCPADARPVLEALASRGYILGLASNYDSRLLSVVAGRPELRPIQHVVVSSEVGWRKPAREFFQAVCRRASAEPAAVVFIGDDLRNDYQGARAAGLKAVLFDSEGRHSEIQPRVRSLGELLTSA